MIIDRTIRRLQNLPARQESDLVATVSLLTDLLAQAGAQTDGPDIETMRNVAELALAAALDTDQRMRDQAQRIADLERQAMSDPLTGVLNRRGIDRALTSALSAARRYGEQGVLLSLDLDGFKFVNDTYGHAAGDKVLRQVARTLSENIRDTDSVGRVGGDEFVVLLTRVSQEQGATRARLLAEQVNSTVVNVEGRAILLRVSFGVQAYGGDDDGAALLSRADEDMYRNKRMRSDRGRAIGCS